MEPAPWHDRDGAEPGAPASVTYKGGGVKKVQEASWDVCSRSRSGLSVTVDADESPSGRGAGVPDPGTAQRGLAL